MLLYIMKAFSNFTRRGFQAIWNSESFGSSVFFSGSSMSQPIYDHGVGREDPFYLGCLARTHLKTGDFSVFASYLRKNLIDIGSDGCDSTYMADRGFGSSPTWALTTYAPNALEQTWRLLKGLLRPGYTEPQNFGSGSRQTHLSQTPFQPLRQLALVVGHILANVQLLQELLRPTVLQIVQV